MTLPSSTQLLKNRLIEKYDSISYFIAKLGIKDHFVQELLASFASQLVIGFYGGYRSFIYWSGYPHSLVKGRYKALYRLLRIKLNHDYHAVFHFLINSMISC